MAYEMRISEWSSDVCSSDLRRFRAYARRRAPVLEPLRSGARAAVAHAACAADAEVEPRRARHLRFQDRKSVVWGKSVSVRVDLGGRRILQKQNNERHKIEYLSL